MSKEGCMSFLCIRYIILLCHFNLVMMDMLSWFNDDQNKGF